MRIKKFFWLVYNFIESLPRKVLFKCYLAIACLVIAIDTYVTGNGSYIVFGFIVLLIIRHFNNYCQKLEELKNPGMQKNKKLNWLDLLWLNRNKRI